VDPPPNLGKKKVTEFVPDKRLKFNFYSNKVTFVVVLHENDDILKNG
jgi:hypothetical protein